MNAEYLDIDNNEDSLFVKKALEEAPGTAAFMAPQYLRAIRDTYRFKVHYLACRENGELTGIASFYEKPHFYGKKLLESVLRGFWALDADSEKKLLDELSMISERNNLGRTHFKDLEKPLMAFRHYKVMYRALVELPEKPDYLDGSYNSNLRRKVSKAKKNGINITENADLKEFYAAWARNMRDLGTPAVPFEFFANLRKNLESDINILTVKKDGTCIGGVLLLGHGDTVICPYISCLREYFRFYPNNLLYHEMLQWAVRKGFKYFDLGRSQPESGNEKFKLQFGAELKALYSYATGKRTVKHDSFGGRLAAACWQKLPLKAANYIGPKIRRYVPFG